MEKDAATALASLHTAARGSKRDKPDGSRTKGNKPRSGRNAAMGKSGNKPTKGRATKKADKTSEPASVG